jgi:hypothetical protein
MHMFSPEASGDALMIKWRAEALAGMHWPHRYRRRVLPSVPRQWTAWLLMDKAGVPRDLIAYHARAHRDYLSKRLLAATAMMILPPYAARIEALMQQMPRFPVVANDLSALEARCVVQAG